jgi:hypothetical protein
MYDPPGRWCAAKRVVRAGLMLVNRWVELLVNPDAHPRADAPPGGGRQGRGHEY